MNKSARITEDNSGDIMKRLKKNIICFIIGGVGYAMIELLWRGRTHWTMVIAGGIGFIIFSRIAENFKERSLIYKAGLCSLATTGIELIFGIICNMIFKMGVWDYSHIPFNFLGQICLLFTLMWGALGFVFVPLADKINEKLGI